MALTPGSRLGVYEVTAQIGEGGMGQVYRAHDTQLHRDVALKVLPEAFAGDVGVVQRRQRLSFAGEPGEAISVVRERVRQDLQRDIAIELRVAGPVDLAHAPFADLRGDFVDAEARAGGESQG